MKNILKLLMNRKIEVLLVVYFIVVTVALAVFIKPGIPPDETIHKGIINYYSTKSADPTLGTQTSDYYLGSLQREASYLYHYVLSLLNRVFIHIGVDGYYALRIVNVSMGVGTVVLLIRISKQLTIERRVANSLVFLLLNIPMFLFISASINYDNLLILLSVASVSLVIDLQRRYSPPRAYLLLIILILGPLVKFAFLPLSFVFGVFLVIRTYQSKSSIALFIKNQQRAALIIASLGVLFTSGLFIERYGLNMLKYSQFNPSCEKIMAYENCKNNFVYDRTQIYKSANLPEPTMSSGVYLSSWVEIMSKRTFGILAHKPYRQSHLVTVLGTVGIYVLIAAFIRKVNSKNIQPWALPVATLLYLSGLLITNHGIYVYSNKIDLAVQGRYWLPVLLPFSIFVASMYKYEEFMKRRTIIGVVPYAFLVAGIMLGPVSIIYGIKGLGWVYIPKMLFSL